MPEQSALIPTSIGIEVADSGTRLTATCGRWSESAQAAPAAETPPRRWHARLDAPPSPDQLLAATLALAERVAGEAGLPSSERVPLGGALWAEVDADRGRVRGLRFAPGWDRTPEGYPFAEALAARWGRPVTLRTAPQAAALAEAHLGAGLGARLMLYVLQGRSLWDVLVYEGRVVTGMGMPDGSLAHWRVAESGPRCACGAVGHLDPLASAQSLVRTMIGRASDSEASHEAMLAASGGRAEAISPVAVVGLAASGEPAALGVVTEALDALAGALVNLAVALRPDRIVWGGPLASSEEWLAPLRARLAEGMPTGIAAPSLVPARLEPAAPLLGACLIARA